MLRFFRRIRKMLIEQKKITSYIFYALGEIVLVVIGILIALSVNNWNEERKNRIEEKAILTALNRDFTKNLEMFTSIKNTHIKAHESAKSIQTLINSPLSVTFFTDENVNLYKAALEHHSFNPYNGVVNSLINSGNYLLLRNDSLQNLIISWNDVLEDYLEEERASSGFWLREFEPFMIENAAFSMTDPTKGIAILSDPIHKTLIERRIHYTGLIIEAIEKEPIEHYLMEIVRLSSVNRSN